MRALRVSAGRLMIGTIALVFCSSIALPWQETEFKLESEDVAPFHGRRFGEAVALDGRYALIGAPYDDYAGTNSGSAYVFVRDATGWSQQEKLIGLDVQVSNRFGYSVALQGHRAVIASPYAVSPSAGRGVLYVFERNGSQWTQTQKLWSTTPSVYDYVGSAVVLDGDRIAAGTNGAVVVFERVGGTWIEQTRLTVPGNGLSNGATLNSEIALDGDTLVIGAPADEQPNLSGSVFVFVKSGTQWTQEARLTAPVPTSGAKFGQSVSIDGDLLAVGEYRHEGLGFESGKAYVFARSGTSWALEHDLVPRDNSWYAQTGFSVAIEGETVVVGSNADDGSGSFYVFWRDGGTWSRQAKRKASDAEAGGRFGYKVALSGGKVLASAPTGGPSPTFGGAAYVVEVPPDADEPGFAFECFFPGLGCPCGNDPNPWGPGLSCSHSSGGGMRIEGSGTNSFTAADLSLTVTDAPPGNTGAFVVGTQMNLPNPPTAFHDGVLCVQGTTYVLRGLFQAGGTLTETGFLAQDPTGAFFVPGLDYFFQYLTRDNQAGSSPCGGLANASPAFFVRLRP